MTGIWPTKKNHAQVGQRMFWHNIRVRAQLGKWGNLSTRK